MMMFDPDPSQKLINAAAACECTLALERNSPSVNGWMIDMEIAVLRTEPLGLLMWVSEQRRFVDGTRPVLLPEAHRQYDCGSGRSFVRVTSRSVHSWPLKIGYHERY